MRKLLILILSTLFISPLLFGQKKTYFSSGGEMIFSFAKIDKLGDEEGDIMRWSPFFNIQGMFNADMGKHFGVFSGLALRNVGYIYDNYRFMENDKEITVKKKFRTYNLGIPVGIKIGDLDGMFLYGGYEIEYPFHYKEKTYRDDGKKKISAWFSKRVEPFQHAFIVGIQFPYGANLKFKYYLSSFHNQSFTESDGFKPYENLDTHIFYFSLNFDLFKDVHSYGSKGSEKYF